MNDVKWVRTTEYSVNQPWIFHHAIVILLFLKKNVMFFSQNKILNYYSCINGCFMTFQIVGKLCASALHLNKQNIRL